MPRSWLSGAVAEDPWAIVAGLMAALPGGSYLTISHPAIDIHHTQANAQRAWFRCISGAPTPAPPTRKAPYRPTAP
jgi:hypothetical protein